MKFNYKIKSANTERLKGNGHHVIYGILKRLGRDGSFNVPGGGGEEMAFYNWDLDREERERWNKESSDFERMLHKVSNKTKKNGRGYDDTNKSLEPRHRAKDS